MEKVDGRRWSVVVLGILACSLMPAVAHGQDVMRMRAETIRPGIHIISGFANGNILALTGRDGILLVDAQSARRVGLADSVLRTLDSAAVRLVIDTHYHDDHIGGNAHWRERGAITLAHHNVLMEAVRDTVIPERNWHRTPAEPASLPEIVFYDSLALHFNGEEILLRHAPAAHTDSDITVWLRHANVIHMGDILELGADPFVDWWAGGSMEGMIAGVDWALGVSDASTIFVPGHGPSTDRAGLLAYRAMLVQARAACATSPLRRNPHNGRVGQSFACRPAPAR